MFLLLSNLYIESYNEDKKSFSTLDQLNERQKQGVYSVLRMGITNLHRLVGSVVKRSLLQTKWDFLEEKQREVNQLGAPLASQLSAPALELPSFTPIACSWHNSDPKNKVLVWRIGFKIHIALFDRVFTASCLDKSGEVLVTRLPPSNISSSSNISPSNSSPTHTSPSNISSSGSSSSPFSVDGQPLTCSPLTSYVDLQLLEKCIRSNNEKAFLFLLSSRALDLKGHAGLITTTCRYGLAGCLEALLSRDPEGEARVDMVKPLRAASINGRTACVKLLVERYGPVILTDGFDSCSPLEMAAAEGHLDTVRLIVEAGGRGVVDLADLCEKIRLDRLMPLEVLVIVAICAIGIVNVIVVELSDHVS